MKKMNTSTQQHNNAEPALTCCHTRCENNECKSSNEGDTDGNTGVSSCNGGCVSFVEMIPRDPDDDRFIISFSTQLEEDLARAADFFDKFGFVVFCDVFTPEECSRTRSGMWDIIERDSPGFQRNCPDTWGTYNSAGKFGLSMRGPCFHPEIVNNRQNPNLIKALERIIGTEDVMVSHDRFTIYRATKYNESFRTGERNVHLDINPWWWCESASEVTDGLSSIQYEDSQDFIKENNLVVKNMGRHVQCVLNFEDNEDSDGGTILVPNFHNVITEWCREDNEKVLASKSHTSSSGSGSGSGNTKGGNSCKQEKKKKKQQNSQEQKHHQQEAAKSITEIENLSFEKVHNSEVVTNNLTVVNDSKEDRVVKSGLCVDLPNSIAHSEGLSLLNLSLDASAVVIQHTEDTFLISNDNGDVIVAEKSVTDPSVSKIKSNKKNVDSESKKEYKKSTSEIKKPPRQKQQQQSQKPAELFSSASKWGTSVRLRQPLPWLIMSEDSVLHSLAQRIPMRAGSVLMWDQTMVHGTQPNAGSSRCRMAMFLKAFDRTKCFVGEEGELRRIRRRVALKKFLESEIQKHIQEYDTTLFPNSVSCGSDDSSEKIGCTEVLPEVGLLDRVLTAMGKKVFDL